MSNKDDRFNPFDVLEKLKDTGFEQDQAESLARFFSDVEFRNMATKQDVAEIRRDIKELDVKIETIRSELKRDIKELELKINESQKKQMTQIEAFQGRESLKIIGAMTGIITLLLAMFRFLPDILNKTS